METTDRAVQALKNMGWAVVPGDTDLPVAVATVLRVVREDLLRAQELGDLTELAEVDEWLASLIEPAESKPLVAMVTVNNQGHLTPDSTVTVGEWTWPVPEMAEHGGVLWAARVFQVLKEHGFRPMRVNGQLAGIGERRPGVVGIRVEPFETKEEGLT